jgi:membrane protease YdiL (CAAX protease family)
MSRQTSFEPQVRVSGRRLGLSLLTAVCAAGAVGSLVYYSLLKIMGNAPGSALAQMVVFAVYATLLIVLCYWFQPPSRPPIALRFTSFRDLAFALGATLIVMAICVLVYAFLGRFFGGARHLLEQLTSVATDAKRLQGLSATTWVIAILRGCLLVPVFEEVFFRGLLLPWLNSHMRFTCALILMAALFAAMHVYPAALPYAFLFGIASGYVRHVTASTFHAVVMHVVNNAVLLLVGLHFFGR